MKIYGLIGWPVSHSLSPVMHNAAFKESQIDANYELFPIDPDHFDDGIQNLKNKNVCGWNITVPHKENIIGQLNSIDRQAEILGSVNTVVNTNGQLKGYSTDGYGLEKALEEAFNIKTDQDHFLFIGAGGAARAAALYLSLQGAPRITIINRTLPRAQAIADDIATHAPQTQVEVIALDDEAKIARACQEASVAIQSTSLGLHAEDALPINPEIIPSSLPVFDMIYKNTPFLQATAKRGCATADGRAMLLHQGVKAWELWTQQKAPIEVMRSKLNEALAQ